LNSQSKLIRKTLLAPTYGGVLQKLIVIPGVVSNLPQLIAYSTPQKVIGLVVLPLDGNPKKSMGLIAHPDQVTNMACSYDGMYLFTAGGSDLTVNMWSIDANMHSKPHFGSPSSHENNDIEEFVQLVDGGRDGIFWQEMKDYFDYAQILSEGEESPEAHFIGTQVALEQVPNILRALGMYPSEQQIDDIINEIKFRDYFATGKHTTHITFDDLIRGLHTLYSLLLSLSQISCSVREPSSCFWAQ
jgi:hypothetical protein